MSRLPPSKCITFLCEKFTICNVLVKKSYKLQIYYFKMLWIIIFFFETRKRYLQIITFSFDMYRSKAFGTTVLVQSWQCTPSTRLSVSQLPALKNKYYSVMFELTIYNEQNLKKLLSRVTVPNYDENMDEKNMTQKYSIKNLYISNKIFGRPSQTRKTSPFKKSNLYSCIISLAAWFCLRVMFDP